MQCESCLAASGRPSNDVSIPAGGTSFRGPGIAIGTSSTGPAAVAAGSPPAAAAAVGDLNPELYSALYDGTEVEDETGDEMPGIGPQSLQQQQQQQRSPDKPFQRQHQQQQQGDLGKQQQQHPGLQRVQAAHHHQQQQQHLSGSPSGSPAKRDGWHVVGDGVVLRTGPALKPQGGPGVEGLGAADGPKPLLLQRSKDDRGPWGGPGAGQNGGLARSSSSVGSGGGSPPMGPVFSSHLQKSGLSVMRSSSNSSINRVADGGGNYAVAAASTDPLGPMVAYASGSNEQWAASSSGRGGGPDLSSEAREMDGRDVWSSTSKQWHAGEQQQQQQQKSLASASQLPGGLMAAAAANAGANGKAGRGSGTAAALVQLEPAGGVRQTAHGLVSERQKAGSPKQQQKQQCQTGNVSSFEGGFSFGPGWNQPSNSAGRMDDYLSGDQNTATGRGGGSPMQQGQRAQQQQQQQMSQLSGESNIEQQRQQQPRQAQAHAQPRQVQHPDGKLEHFYADGKRVTTYTNGTTKANYPDGSSSIRFRNGDYKRQWQDGRVDYYYAEVATWQSSYRGGLEVFHFPTGQREGHHADGVKEIVFPDGTCRRVLPDG